MKKLSLLLMTIAFIASSCTMENKSSEAKFTVKGNCSMCEKTIEAAALSIDGVSSAEWNKDTKEIKVKYDNKKSDVKAIHIAIANSGYDTDMMKAKDEKYNSLSGCCQYER